MQPFLQRPRNVPTGHGVAACLVLAGLLAGAGQAASATTLGTREHSQTSTTVLTGDGKPLYLRLDDGQGASDCYDVCALNWPPLLADGDTELGEGIDPALVGTIERRDGTTQLTYNGWPLYRFARDLAPTVTLGQGFEGVWHLVTIAGEAAGYTAPVAVGAVADADVPALIAAGHEVWTTFCAACHGATGAGGGSGPSLVGNGDLAASGAVIRQILNGGGDMPGFGQFLDDDDVAAVATYVRMSWGNQFGAVPPEEVSARR